ncbi:MAG: radical SAM protein [Eubacteriales bacterium]|nr:radical SAM protein [Eubacteriales bacterium]
MMVGKTISKHYENEHYKVFFNQQTGFFIRCEDGGYPEPKWSKHGPELLDISITNYCERGCDFCYRSSSREGRHISLDDYEFLVKQAADLGVLQIALGGGNPNQHPEFAKVLELTREYDIIPSYTTNGEGLTDEILDATAKYCGAMAISFYPSNGLNYYERLVSRTRLKGIKTNLHVILSSETIDAIESLLSVSPKWLNNVNAIIFLNFKPVGRGKGSMGLSNDRAKTFFERLAKTDRKIGFDSCSISGIVRWMNVKPEFVESCEAARFSAFIREDLKMYPCSFMSGTEAYGDLRERTMLEIWQENEAFKRFRLDAPDVSCNGCDHWRMCKGGCRLYKEINFC